MRWVLNNNNVWKTKLSEKNKKQKKKKTHKKKKKNTTMSAFFFLTFLRDWEDIQGNIVEQ